MSESKNAKFKRLARLRGNRVLKDVRLLANLANRNNYDYTDEEVRKLFGYIEDELKLARSSFQRRGKRELEF